MSHDAAQTLAARIRSLSLAPDLQDILAELAERTEPEPPAAAAHESEYQAILDRAAAPLRGGQHARRPCHLRVISGGLAAIAAAVGLAWRWTLRSGAHQAVVTVVGAAMVGAAAVPVAVSVMPYSTPARTAPSVNAHHIRPGHHDAPGPALVPAITPPRRRHRRVHHDYDYDAPTPSPSPTATGSPVPTPTPADTPTPTATPSPTATAGDGDGLRVVVHQGALRGLPWPNMLHHVSRGQDAAPG